MSYSLPLVLSLYGRIILKHILEEQGLSMWSRFIWLVLEYSGRSCEIEVDKKLQDFMAMKIHFLVFRAVSSFIDVVGYESFGGPC